MSRHRSITVGTRGGALALCQADLIVALLRARFPDRRVLVLRVQTAGDRAPDRPITEIGDKGVFVRAIEQTVLAGEVDIAVHSLKDVPSDVATPGLVLAGFSAREDPRDALLSATGDPLDRLPAGSRVGTSSLRRRVQLQAVRPDLAAAEIRGNVDTRLRRLEDGQYQALILAAAGLRRLGLADAITQYLPVDLFVPDAGQGIIALQTRPDTEAEVMAQAVSDPRSSAAARAERATVRALQADCHSPVGAYARIDGEHLRLRAMAATEDGNRLVRAEQNGGVGEAEELGRAVGEKLLRMLDS